MARGEVQVYREREFLYVRRWATRALALEEVDDQWRGVSGRGAFSSRRCGPMVSRTGSH
jgi:hypothetical protein